MTMANLDSYSAVYLYHGLADGAICYTMHGKTTASGFYIMACIVCDGPVEVYTSAYNITDAPHYIEVKLTRATNSTSVNGSLELWIDGAIKETLSGYDNYDQFVNFQEVRFGAVANLDIGTSGTCYFDQLVINNDGGIIGPVMTGTNYYVSTSGSNTNPGTITLPWRTLQKAADTAQAGSTVYLRGGVYNERVDFDTYSGTNSSPIVFSSYPGETAVIDGTGIAGNALIRLASRSWLVFQNLEVRNCIAEAGIWAGSSSDCSFYNVISHDNYSQGAVHSTCYRFTYDTCKFYNNDGILGGSDGIAFAGGGNNIIRHCEAYGNGDDGFDVWSSPGCTIEYCDSHDHNIGDSNGFKIGGNSGGLAAGGSNIIRFNRAWNNGECGFTTNGAGDNEVYNNTALNNNTKPVAWGCDYRNVNLSATANRYHNNISLGNDVHWDTGPYHTDHNTWDAPAIANPDFVSVVPGNAQYLHLNSTSPCIDAGIYMGVAYSGTAPDMGAYEYISSTGDSGGTFHPMSSVDDGRWNNDSVTWNTSAGLLDIGKESTVLYATYIRFPNFTVPNGATINSAYLKLTSGNTVTSTQNQVIRANDVDNAAQPTTWADINGRVGTTAGVAWTIVNPVIDTLYTSPDIKSVIQEIVNRAGWVSGNALMLLIKDEAQTSTNDWWPYAYDHATAAPPELVVDYDYTTGGSNDAGADTVTATGNYLVSSPVYIGAANYTNTTITGNTFIYDAAQPAGSESNFPSNSWIHAYPTTGVHIVARPYDWDAKQGNVTIFNWSGASTVTLSASDLVGFTLQAGDTIQLKNHENPLVDILTFTYNGTSITVPMTGHTQLSTSGGLAAPTSSFPYFGSFRMVIGGGSAPPPSGDVIAPTIPTGLTAVVISSSQINLSWTPSTDAVGVAGYGIYRDGTLIGSSGDASYQSTGLSPATLYAYTVDAYDAAGNRSAQSAQTTATTQSITPPPSGANHYVGPSGSSSNNGQRATPWSLSYALGGAGGQITGGDVVYLLTGDYSVSQITIDLAGSSSNYITFMAEPGATVRFIGTDTATQTFIFNNVSYVVFQDIIFTSTSSYSRVTPTTASSAGCMIITGSAGAQSYVKFRGCIFHNSRGMGVKWWQYCTNGEFNGCLIFMNGQAPSYDHGVYGRNNTGNVHKYKDCVLHNNAAYNFHYYADQTDRNINDVTVERCVLYNPTSLYSGYSTKNNLLIGGNSNTIDPKVDGCFFASDPASGFWEMRVGYSASYSVTGAIVTNNFSVGRPWNFPSSNWSGQTVSNNTIKCTAATDANTTSILNAGSGNVITTIPITGTDIFLRTYDWNNKRGNLIIYNYSGNGSVTLTAAVITAASFNLPAGATYSLTNTADPFSDVITGTYNGTSISVPMTGRTIMTPYGGLSKPAQSFPTFGCFVLRNLS
jgi:hypothetical protein